MAMTLAKPRGGPGGGASKSGARLRVTVWLRGQDCLEVWDDRVVAPDDTYTLDEFFGVQVLPDPRAPLTVEAPLGVSLLTHSGRWNTYVPASEADVWTVLFAIRQACQARGVEPIGMTEKVALPSTWKKTPAPAPQPEPVWREAVVSEPVRPTPVVTAPIQPAPVAPESQPLVARAGARITRKLAAVTAPIATLGRASEPHAYDAPQPANAPADEPRIYRTPLPAYVPENEPRVYRTPLPAYVPENEPRTYRTPLPAHIPASQQHAYDIPQPAYAAAQNSGFAARRLFDDPDPALTSDGFLAALTHLSLVFLPVVLPVVVWLSLRLSVPHVAQQARQAVFFQSGIYVVALPLLGYAFANATAHGFTLAAQVGLIGFVTLLAAATVYAFYAAMQNMHGYRFRYLGFIPLFQ